jgi:hypothetical protein
MPDFSTTTVSNVIAVTLGLLSLVFGVLLPAIIRWRRERRAELEVRLEKFWRTDTSGLASRIVIKNHGPAIARQVALTRLANTDGKELDLGSMAASPTPPVARLLANQEFHIIVQFMQNHGHLSVIDAEWKDDSGVRSGEFVVSPHYV